MTTKPAESLATVTRSTNDATVTFERRFNRPIADVWRAITDPSGLAAWLADASVDLRVGGAIQVQFDDEPMNGIITDLEPERVIAYSWHEGMDRESHVRFDLSQNRDGTILRVVHVRLNPSSATGFAAGWHHHLELLAAHLSGTDIEWSSPRFHELEELYSVPRFSSGIE